MNYDCSIGYILSLFLSAYMLFFIYFFSSGHSLGAVGWREGSEVQVKYFHVENNTIFKLNFTEMRSG